LAVAVEEYSRNVPSVETPDETDAPGPREVAPRVRRRTPPITPLPRPGSVTDDVPTEVRVNPELLGVLKSSMVTAAAGVIAPVRQERTTKAPNAASRPRLASVPSINVPSDPNWLAKGSPRRMRKGREERMRREVCRESRAPVQNRRRGRRRRSRDGERRNEPNLASGLLWYRVSESTSETVRRTQTLVQGCRARVRTLSIRASV
jgi:hypothetical protein